MITEPTQSAGIRTERRHFWSLMVETGYYVVEEIVQLLVEEGTDVNAAVLKGIFLLFLELYDGDRYKHDIEELFQLFIDVGADRRVISNY